MAKTQSKKHQKYVRDIVTALKYALYLNGWDIAIDHHEDDELHRGDPMAASMNVSPNYLEAKLCIYPIFWEGSDNDRKKTLIHEMCHIHTGKTKELWERLANGKIITADEEVDINEYITTMMQRLACVDDVMDRLRDIEL